MARVWIKRIIVGSIVLGVLLAALFLTVGHQTAQASIPPDRIGGTQTTAEGVQITLLNVEKHPGRWLFHFKIKNATGTVYVVHKQDLPTPAGSHADQKALDGQFIIPVVGSDRRVVEARPLSTPNATEAAAHAAVPTGVLADKETVDAWLAVDITDIGAASPAQLLYWYDPVTTQKCSDPSKPSTCTPDTLYHGLIWNLH